MYNQNKYQACQKVLEKLEEKYPGNEQLNKLHQNVDNDEREARETFDKAQQKLLKGEVDQAQTLIDKTLQNYSDMSAAVSLRSKLDSMQGKQEFLLKSQHNKNINIFFKRELLIGREDTNNQPDIEFDDRRISREHTRISIVDGKITIEDLNSTGGTYINGEEVTSKKIHTGTRITLAKVIDLDVKVYAKEGEIRGLILSGPNNHYLLIPIGIGFTVRKEKITLKDPTYEILYKNKIPIIKIQDNVKVFQDDLEFKFGKNYYNTEVIK